MSSLRLLSPAKLNRFLHITGRRSDGYHELQTLFQLLDWGDTMNIETLPEPALTLRCEQLDIPTQQNLAWRAARLLQTYCGVRSGAHISIEKRIPDGGGLGGGSSNAATVLLALNHLWQLHLTLDELAELGVQLGADVPIFVHGHTAWAEGIGDKLEAVTLADSHFLIIFPNCKVSTAEVFSQRQLTRNTSPITMAAFFEGTVGNDCEDVVRHLYPEVDKALIWLNKFGHAQLTGTGSCVFSGYETRAEAEAALAQLPAIWQGFAVEGVNQSPVHRALN